ncbi:hypothetical protein LAZ67_3003767 [Cordylochernes scorpioides]|uniref:Uncharacterized protein n=1 Tax=Cordylochernes scorpioides TaxID=51811 RepID=A0ABY6K8T3_9ARAC|nr:hypothetical protein LAZ67_3003767 [Cordylochernes scorpioides]
MAMIILAMIIMKSSSTWGEAAQVRDCPVVRCRVPLRLLKISTIIVSSCMSSIDSSSGEQVVSSQQAEAQAVGVLEAQQLVLSSAQL